MALSDIITLLLSDTPSCLLPAKQSVWLISKYFKGKIYCSDWIANIPRSHSVVRPVRVVMQDQRAMTSSWGTAKSGRENIYNPQIRQGQRHQSWRIRLCPAVGPVVRWDIMTYWPQISKPDNTTLLHFSSFWICNSVKLVPLAAWNCHAVPLLPCQTAAMFQQKRWLQPGVCKLRLWSTSEWFGMKGMVLNITSFLLDKTTEAPSCTLEEMGKCF